MMSHNENKNMFSLAELIKVCEHLDNGIEYLEKELRNPQTLLYNKTESSRNEAECELDSVAEEVNQLKLDVKSTVDHYDNQLKLCEEDIKDGNEFLNEIKQELKKLELNYQQHGYIPYKFPTLQVEKKDKTKSSDLCSLSPTTSELIENISPVSVLDIPITPEDNFIGQKFIPSLNSTLLNTNKGSPTDTVDNNWSSVRALNPELTPLKPTTPPNRRAPSSQSLLCTPSDPGCSLVSLEVTGRSVHRLKKRLREFR